jgi:hypothetical protein
MRVGSKYYCNSGTSFGERELTTTNVSACEGAGITGSGGNTGAVIAFNSTKTASAGGSATCRLIEAYRFKPEAQSGGYIIERAIQSGCGRIISENEFSPLIDPRAVITGYHVRGVPGSSYPLLLVRISGYAGDRERERTYFNVQTAISPRIP